MSLGRYILAVNPVSCLSVLQGIYISLLPSCSQALKSVVKKEGYAMSSWLPQISCIALLPFITRLAPRTSVPNMELSCSLEITCCPFTRLRMRTKVFGITSRYLCKEKEGNMILHLFWGEKCCILRHLMSR